MIGQKYYVKEKRMTPEQAQELKAGDMIRITIFKDECNPIVLDFIAIDENYKRVHISGIDKLGSRITDDYDFTILERYIPDPKQCDQDTCTMVVDLQRDLKILQDELMVKVEDNKNYRTHNEQLKEEIAQIRVNNNFMKVQIQALVEQLNAENMSLKAQKESKVIDSNRYFVDIRGGCGAVRDRLHPEYDRLYKGLHDDTIDVVLYKHGIEKRDENNFIVWDMSEIDINILNNYCAYMNSIHESEGV